MIETILLRIGKKFALSLRLPSPKQSTGFVQAALRNDIIFEKAFCNNFRD